MDTAARNVKVGITTDELDRIVHEVYTTYSIKTMYCNYLDYNNLSE